jgi:ABC-type uncharacterized transport system ATPase subunit
MSLLDIRGVSVHFGGVHALEQFAIIQVEGNLLQCVNSAEVD